MSKCSTILEQEENEYLLPSPCLHECVKNALSCIIQSTKIQKIKIYCPFDIRKEFLKYLILIKNYSTKEKLLLTPSKTSQLRGYLNQSDVSIVVG